MFEKGQWRFHRTHFPETLMTYNQFLSLDQKFNKKGVVMKVRDISANVILKHTCPLCHQISSKFQDHSLINCLRSVHNLQYYSKDT